MMTYPSIQVPVQLPSKTAFIYRLESAVRLPNGDWLAVLWLADHDRREIEGAWLCRRKAPTPEQPRPPFVPVDTTPLVPGHGVLAEGQGAALQFLTFDRSSITFVRVGEPGTMAQQ